MAHPTHEAVVSPEVGCNTSRVHGIGGDFRVPQPLGQLISEHQVRQFRASIGNFPVVGLRTKVSLEVYTGATVGSGGDGDHPGELRRLQLVEQQQGQQEMTQMICREGQFDIVRTEFKRIKSRARIVDQDVDARAAASDGGRQFAHLPLAGPRDPLS